MFVHFSRRELAVFLPGFAAVGEHREDQQANERLHSAGYDFTSLPERTSPNGKIKSRSVFRGITTRGQRLTMHISELASGQEPHAPERQPHEDVIVIRDETLTATLNGNGVRLQ